MIHLHVEGDLLGARWGSVRVHLDPSVQEAGENHPTDLKTASVGSKGINVAECAVEKI